MTGKSIVLGLDLFATTQKVDSLHQPLHDEVINLFIPYVEWNNRNGFSNPIGKPGEGESSGADLPFIGQDVYAIFNRVFSLALCIHRNFRVGDVQLTK
jgi:hypothetical protein